MKVVEPKVAEEVMVQVALLRNNQGFRAPIRGLEDGYGYYVKCDPNEQYLTILYKQKNITFTDRNDAGWTLIFNVKENGLGIIKSDSMVEPIDMTVNMERK
jgi:hypothetical protein